MKTTKIEWTDKTWNPITGCSKISQGCVHCYAEVMSRRLKAMGQKKYANEFQLTLHEDCLKEPFLWKNPHTIFVCSMSDLFHKDVPFEFIDKVMQTIRETPQHRYQLLTKRAERMADYFHTRETPRNAWLGVTVECKTSKTRIDCLTKTHAVEFDFANKWHESIGQALHYQKMTGKRAKVVLILEKPEEEMKYFKRVEALGKIHNFDVEYVTPEILNLKDDKCPYEDCKCHRKKAKRKS